MVLGKLLDSGGSLFLADHTAAGRLVDRAAFYGDHLTGFVFDFWLDIFLGSPLGCRRPDVRVGYAVPRHVPGQFRPAWIYFGLRSAGTFHLLQLRPHRRENDLSRI